MDVCIYDWCNVFVFCVFVWMFLENYLTFVYCSTKNVSEYRPERPGIP